MSKFFSYTVWQLVVDLIYILLWFVQIRHYHVDSLSQLFVATLIIDLQPRPHFLPNSQFRCFNLIDFSPGVRSWSPFLGGLCPPTRGPRMGETQRRRLESKKLNFYSGRLSSFAVKTLDLSLTWSWRLGTRVLEDPVIGVWGEGEGGWGELLVDSEGEGGGRGGHLTPNLPLQLWQGHSPKTPTSSWIFQSHPSGSICLSFNSSSLLEFHRLTSPIMSWLLLWVIFFLHISC